VPFLRCTSKEGFIQELVGRASESAAPPGEPRDTKDGIPVQDVPRSARQRYKPGESM